MPKPLAICIENCYPPHEGLRYLRCTAITGVDPGLAVTPAGEVVWKGEGPVLCEIWVSSDEKLICFRPPSATAGARVHRAGREVVLEENKPVVVIDGDYLLLPGRCYRLHVHGQAPAVTEPRYLDFEEPASSTWARLAAAGVLVLGTVAVPACGRPSGDETQRVEVRDQPPSVEPVMEPPMEEPPPPMEVRDEPPKIAKPDPEPPAPPPLPPEKTDAGVPDQGSDMKKTKPIEVRPVPPAVPPPIAPTPPPQKPPTGTK